MSWGVGVPFQWPKLLRIPACSFLVCSFPKRTKKKSFSKRGRRFLETLNQGGHIRICSFVSSFGWNFLVGPVTVSLITFVFVVVCGCLTLHSLFASKTKKVKSEQMVLT